MSSFWSVAVLSPLFFEVAGHEAAERAVGCCSLSSLRSKKACHNGYPTLPKLLFSLLSSTMTSLGPFSLARVAVLSPLFWGGAPQPQDILVIQLLFSLLSSDPFPPGLQLILRV